MHLTDHVTDVQLNEYLDNESAERAQIESHLASCDECAARLTALKTLFAEIESLPELELTRSFAARFNPTPSLTVPQLPRFLTLTVTLQAVAASIALIFAAPSISRFISLVLQAYPIPSLNDVAVRLQINFVAWLQLFQSFQLPAIPIGLLTLPKELSTFTLSISVVGIFFVWIIGNWWLLRKYPNSPA